MEKSRSWEPSQAAHSYEHIENFTKDLQLRRNLGKSGVVRSSGLMWGAIPTDSNEAHLPTPRLSNKTEIYALSQHVSVFVWKPIVFLQFDLPSTRIPWKRSPKPLYRVESFENGGFSFTCGWTETEVFEYDDLIHLLLLAWRMPNKGCYRISFVFPSL